MSRGISTRRTKLGFNILRLHYTADPDKDPQTPAGAAWLASAKSGMSEARWRQEYEIDYGALGGQLVFPEWDPSIHLVPPSRLDPDEWTITMACDPHPRTQHAFIWLGVNRDGDMVVPFSWWQESDPSAERRLTVKDYAEWMIDVEKTLGFYKPRRLMDVAGRSMNATEEKSYFDSYRDEKFYFQAAKKNRDMSGFELINKALRPESYVVDKPETKKPRLTIMSDNDELIYQISHLRFAEFRGSVVDKDDPQMPIEKRRHLVDGLCYILLDKPRFRDRSRPLTPYRDPNVINGSYK